MFDAARNGNFLNEGLTPSSSGSDEEGRSPNPSSSSALGKRKLADSGEGSGSFTPAAKHPKHSVAMHPRAGDTRPPAAMGSATTGSTNTTLRAEACELAKTSCHFPDFQRFIDNLNQAYRARWATRHQPYRRVCSLLIQWEDDDLGVVQEINDLKRILEDTYLYDVETWAIPSTKTRYEGLINKIRSVIKEYDADGNLVILYYGGHALQVEGQVQPTWVSTRDGGMRLHASAFLYLFEEIDADVLFLFDSCQAAPQSFQSLGNGVAASLTATGFEPNAVGTAAEVGSHSFTHALIQVLGVLSRPENREAESPVYDVSIHALLVAELKKCPASLEKRKDGSFKRDRNGDLVVEPFRRRTPIYQFLSSNKTPRPIPLAPLKPATTLDESIGSASRISADKGVFRPAVLISIRLTPDYFTSPDIDAWVKCLLNLPCNIGELSITGDEIAIEGVYPSHSSILILRIPTDIWSLLPKTEALSFIGFVTGRNYASEVTREIEWRALAKLKEVEKCSERMATAERIGKGVTGYPNPSSPYKIPKYRRKLSLKLRNFHKDDATT